MTIKLVRYDDGSFDVALDDGSDASDAAATVIYAVLLTDALAPAARVPDTFDARGWWSEPDAGTGLWHVRRQALDDAARAETIQMIQSALARESAFTNVAVEEDAASDRNVSLLRLKISGQHNGRQFLIDFTL